MKINWHASQNNKQAWRWTAKLKRYVTTEPKGKINLHKESNLK